MAWAKLDDSFHSHPKALRAFEQCDASISLYTFALAYAADYDLDGKVPAWWVRRAMPEPDRRDEAVSALVQAGLWRTSGNDHYLINDYLHYNPSKAQLEEKRRKDSERKAQERAA